MASLMKLALSRSVLPAVSQGRHPVDSPSTEHIIVDGTPLGKEQAARHPVFFTESFLTAFSDVTSMLDVLLFQPSLNVSTQSIVPSQSTSLSTAHHWERNKQHNMGLLHQELLDDCYVGGTSLPTITQCEHRNDSSDTKHIVVDNTPLG